MTADRLQIPGTLLDNELHISGYTASTAKRLPT